MCGSQDMVKQDGYFVCQFCGTKYTVEEAKKLMIEGTVEVHGTVKVDNSDSYNKNLQNARRAYEINDWGNVEKYYSLIEQENPNNIEAAFFSVYGKAMATLRVQPSPERAEKFDMLENTIPIIFANSFENTDENKEQTLKLISGAIKKMYSLPIVCSSSASDFDIALHKAVLLNGTKFAYIEELKKINENNEEPYISNIIDDLKPKKKESTTSSGSSSNSTGGCYVATAVYGSYDCPEVWTLRRFRDYTLAESVFGRLFIRLYYAVSPTLVKWFGKTEWFKNLWKPTLDKMVAKLNADGVEDTPYEDKNW